MSAEAVDYAFCVCEMHAVSRYDDEPEPLVRRPPVRRLDDLAAHSPDVPRRTERASSAHPAQPSAAAIAPRAFAWRSSSSRKRSISASESSSAHSAAVISLLTGQQYPNPVFTVPPRRRDAARHGSSLDRRDRTIAQHADRRPDGADTSHACPRRASRANAGAACQLRREACPLALHARLVCALLYGKAAWWRSA